MISENFELIEAVGLNLCLAGLFILMTYAVHDVLKKNKVPLIGQVVVYFVLFLGAAGFIFKGVMQLFIGE